MPQDNRVNEHAASAAEPQGVTTGVENNTGTEPAQDQGDVRQDASRPSQARHLTSEGISSPEPRTVLEKLGVPVELHGEIGKGTSPNAVVDDDDEPEAGGQRSEVGKEEAEEDVPQKGTGEAADTAATTEETEPEASKDKEEEVEEETVAPKDAKPGWERKRIGQLARQKRELKERIEELEAQLGDDKEPVFVDRRSDPLAHITTPEALQKIREDARQLRKWCHVNRDGATLEAGTDKERVIAPEQVAQWLSEAEDLLDEVPRKAAQLQQRDLDDELARKVYPPLFDKRSQEYQIGKMLDRELPGLATHPSRNLVIGDYLAGAKARLEREAKRNGSVSQKESATTRNLPEALTRNQNGHIPPIAPETARVPSNSPAVPHARKLVADATKNVIEDGGSMESIKALILAKRQANKNSAHPRSAVAV